MEKLGSERLNGSGQSVPQEDARPCPVCGTAVPGDAFVCFGCGEVVRGQAKSPPEPVGTGRRLLRDRLLFHLGLVLVALGGPGIALGSLLHDVLRIPIIGSAYEAFGHVNFLFAIVGLVALIVGVTFVIMSLRGGVIEDAAARETGGRRETSLPESL